MGWTGFTAIMSLPRRLKLGAAVLLAMAALCFPVAALLGEPVGADPVRCALLPPGRSATLIVLTDGGVVAAPQVERTETAAILRWAGGETSVAEAKIQEVHHHRYWLGSDRFGRDVAIQLLRGGRISLTVAVLSAVIALLLGTAVGIGSATAGPVVDSVLMRLVDGFLAFPILFLMILVAATFRPGPAALILVLGATSWMGLARLVRGQVLSLRQRPFILAAQASGSRWYRIWGQHHLPHLVGPVSQDTALRLGDLVIAEATLSYLGLGVPPSIPTWGSMISQGHRVMLDGWWLATLPGLAIAAVVISFALIGDGIQQMLVEDSA